MVIRRKKAKIKPGDLQSQKGQIGSFLSSDWHTARAPLVDNTSVSVTGDHYLIGNRQ